MRGGEEGRNRAFKEMRKLRWTSPVQDSRFSRLECPVSGRCPVHMGAACCDGSSHFCVDQKPLAGADFCLPTTYHPSLVVLFLFSLPSGPTTADAPSSRLLPDHGHEAVRDRSCLPQVSGKLAAGRVPAGDSHVVPALGEVGA